MRSFTQLVASVWTRLVAVPVLLAMAEHDLRRAHILSARRRFLRAAARAPASFRAHFGLARVYLMTDDAALARRELVLARQLAPARFRELRRQLPAPYRDEDHVLPPTPYRVVALADPTPPTQYGDCRDRDEWRHFQELGPIQAAETADIDWDELLAEIRRQDG